MEGHWLQLMCCCVVPFPNVYVPNFKLEDLHQSCLEWSVSGDTPSHTSAIPDPTPPLGWNSALLPFPNSALPSSQSSAPLSLLELP